MAAKNSKGSRCSRELGPYSQSRKRGLRESTMSMSGPFISDTTIQHSWLTSHPCGWHLTGNVHSRAMFNLSYGPHCWDGHSPSRYIAIHPLCGNQFESLFPLRINSSLINYKFLKKMLLAQVSTVWWWQYISCKTSKASHLVANTHSRIKPRFYRPLGSIPSSSMESSRNCSILPCCRYGQLFTVTRSIHVQY